MIADTRDEDRPSDQHQQIYLRRLHRLQLSLSLLALGVCAAAVGSLVLVMALVPAVRRATVIGIPVALLMVVLPVFPVYVLIGRAYERRANELDHALAVLAEEDQS